MLVTPSSAALASMQHFSYLCRRPKVGNSLCHEIDTVGIFLCKYTHPLTSEHRHSVVKALLFTQSKYSQGCSTLCAGEEAFDRKVV